MLSRGDTGAAVLAVQQRLTALGYWLGTPDGTFRDSTVQAVYALQKAAETGSWGRRPRRHRRPTRARVARLRPGEQRGDDWMWADNLAPIGTAVWVH